MLIKMDEMSEPINAIPRMSAIPVNIRRVGSHVTAMLDWASTPGHANDRAISRSLPARAR
jgi:hypothetical protein